VRLALSLTFPVSEKRASITFEVAKEFAFWRREATNHTIWDSDTLKLKRPGSERNRATNCTASAMD
jgi:hypothetical protein